MTGPGPERRRSYAAQPPQLQFSFFAFLTFLAILELALFLFLFVPVLKLAFFLFVGLALIGRRMVVLPGAGWPFVYQPQQPASRRGSVFAARPGPFAAQPPPGEPARGIQRGQERFAAALHLRPPARVYLLSRCLD